jgi:hypothetical protein
MPRVVLGQVSEMASTQSAIPTSVSVPTPPMGSFDSELTSISFVGGTPIIMQWHDLWTALKL